MTTSDTRAGDMITGVEFTDDTMRVDLADGRSITVPLASYPTLLHATRGERENWEISGAGFGLHWPDLDEDLSVEGLIRGTPAVAVQKPGAGGTA